MKAGRARLREVVIEVGDVVRAVRFYADRGLDVTKRGRWEGGAYAELADPEGLKLVLVEGHGGIRLTVSVEDARAALADAAKDGAVIQQPATPVGGGLWGTATDPWGNRLGFWSPAPGDAG
ncbi:MAG: VOC family protein [Actinomycetota bacterium]|nr:VOC family protein [Actinomycetota bacterium]